MEGQGIYGSTLLAETYTKTVRCPYCGAELDKVVKDLKGNVHGQEFHNAFMHIHYECKQCKVILKENYVNEYGAWNK